MPRPRTAETDMSGSTKAFQWIWAATAVAVPLVYVRDSLYPFYSAKLFALQSGLLLMCVLWRLRARNRDVAILPRSSITLPVLFYAALSTLSILQAANRFEAVAQLGQRISVVLLFLLVLVFLRGKGAARLLKPVVLTCSATSFIGILQYSGLGFLGLPTFGQPGATLGYRNFAAMYTIGSIPLGFYLLADARKRRVRALWATGLVLMLSFLVCTRSRGAWAGLVVAALAVGLTAVIGWSRGRLHGARVGKRAGFPLTVAAFGLIFALGFSFLISPRMGPAGFAAHSPEKADLAHSLGSALASGSDKDRLAMWRNTLDMIRDHSLSGVGIGNWQFVYPDYDRGDVVWKGATPRRPHNDYLWTAAQLGIPGLLAFLWLIWTGLRQAVRLALGAARADGFWLPACLGASIVALLGHAAFSFPSERISSSMLFWGVLGMVGAIDARKPAPGRNPQPGGRWMAGLAVAIAALGLWMTGRAIAFHRHYARSERLLAQRNWAGVAAETRAALAYGPVDPQVYLQRGLAHYSMGNYAAAIRDNLACLEYHPSLVNALNNLGMAYNAAEQYEQAREVLSRIRKIAPRHQEACANMGVALEGLSDLEAASSEYRRYLAARPGNAGIRHRLGAVYLKQGKTDSAIACFREVLAVASGYLPAQVALGEALVQSGDTSSAVSSYRSFLQAGSGKPEAVDLVQRRLRELLGD